MARLTLDLAAPSILAKTRAKLRGKKKDQEDEPPSQLLASTPVHTQAATARLLPRQACNDISLTYLLSQFPILESIVGNLIIRDVSSLAAVSKTCRTLLAPTGALSTSIIKAARPCMGAWVPNFEVGGGDRSVPFPCEGSPFVRHWDSRYCEGCGEAVCGSCRFGHVYWDNVYSTRLQVFSNSDSNLILRSISRSLEHAMREMLSVRPRPFCKKHNSVRAKQVKQSGECACESGVESTWLKSWLCTVCVIRQLSQLNVTDHTRVTSSRKSRCAHVDEKTGEQCTCHARQLGIKQCQLCQGLVGPLHPRTTFAGCCVQFLGILGAASGIYAVLCAADVFPRASRRAARWTEKKIMRNEGAIERVLERIQEGFERRVDALEAKMDLIGLD